MIRGRLTCAIFILAPYEKHELFPNKRYIRYLVTLMILKPKAFVPEPSNLILPEKTAKTVVDDYLEMAKEQLRTLGVNQIRILGSYGRQDAFVESDMDVWLICNHNIVENIQSIAKLSQIELSLRKKVAEKHELHNLARHKATILSKREANLYQASFYTRVTIPYTLQEQTKVSLEKMGRISGGGTKNNKTADLIVSLAEFVGNWEKAVSHKLSTHTQNKWIRRIAQEVEYTITGTRHISTNSLNKLLASKYRNSLKKLFASTDALTKKLMKDVSRNELVYCKLTHHLMWTLEKVRWELINYYATPELFEKWRCGLSKSYGFYPREIGNLVLQCLNTINNQPTNTSKLGTDLIVLSRERGGKKVQALVEDFHNTLRTWLTKETSLLLRKRETTPVFSKTILLPTIHREGGKTISRFGSGNASRLIVAEHEAYNKLYQKDIYNFQEGTNSMVLTIKDFGGSSVSDKALTSVLSKYAYLLLQIHKIRTIKFGRLGSPYLFDTYKDYLISRIRYAPIPPATKNRLYLFVGARERYLRGIQPVLCHMDPGPRNLIRDSEDRLRILDFEHASGCCCVWDIERVLFKLPKKHHRKFITLYYGKFIPNEELVFCTRVIMLATFASNLGKGDEALKTLCSEYIKKCLSCSVGEPLSGITTSSVL